jgi:hypothetical protein
MPDNRGLVDIIDGDGSFKDDKEKKILFRSYAVLYEQDLETNLGLTSIELNALYFTDNPLSWRKFLNHSSVKKFIDGFLQEKAEKLAMKRLGENTVKTTEALKVMEMIDSKKTGADNSNILVVFMPQKDYS